MGGTRPCAPSCFEGAMQVAQGLMGEAIGWVDHRLGCQGDAKLRGPRFQGSGTIGDSTPFGYGIQGRFFFLLKEQREESL